MACILSDSLIAYGKCGSRIGTTIFVIFHFKCAMNLNKAYLVSSMFVYLIAV